MQKLLRYRDLEERGIFRNRVTLKNWIEKHGFPPGQLIGPNTRTWTMGEVEEWLSTRPRIRSGRPPQRAAEAEAGEAA